MEKVCKNCEYFVPSSVGLGKCNWGDCTKPGSCAVDVNGKRERGAFTWDDKTCSDFKPKEKMQ